MRTITLIDDDFKFLKGVLENSVLPNLPADAKVSLQDREDVLARLRSALDVAEKLNSFDAAIVLKALRAVADSGQFVSTKAEEFFVYERLKYVGAVVFIGGGKGDVQFKATEDGRVLLRFLENWPA